MTPAASHYREKMIATEFTAKRTPAAGTTTRAIAYGKTQLEDESPKIVDFLLQVGRQRLRFQ